MKQLTPLLLGLLIAALTDCAKAEEDSLKKIVQSEYPAALRALENHYDRVNGTANYSLTRYDAGVESVRTTSTHSFALSKPERAKLSVKSSGRLGTKHGPSQTVICYNEQYSFVLSRKGDAEFSIKSLETGGDSAMSQMRRELSLSLYAPFQMFVLSLDAVFKAPGFTIRGVSELSRESKRMLKIDFEYPSKRGGRYEGSLLVSPEEKWTLYEYEYRQTRGAGLRKGTISYEGSHSQGDCAMMGNLA